MSLQFAATTQSTAGGGAAANFRLRTRSPPTPPRCLFVGRRRKQDRSPGHLRVLGFHGGVLSESCSHGTRVPDWG